MTTNAELNIEGRLAKTRMPFRAAAFLLGILFIAFGFYQLFGGAADTIALISAIFIALTGLQFVYSAFTEKWNSPFVWSRGETFGEVPARFLIVEPVSFGITDAEICRHSDSPDQAINPYAPPQNLPARSVAHVSQTQEATLQTLTQRFLDGRPFIHYGVVFFLDANDDEAIHAALPLPSPSDMLVSRNVNEAIRVLPEFLSSLPNAVLAVSGRNLVVRTISSYDRLDDEVYNRIVVLWAAILASDGEPSDGRGVTDNAFL